MLFERPSRNIMISFRLSLFCFHSLIFILFLSIYFSNFGRHIVLFKYTLYKKNYILKVFKLLSFLLCSSFQGVSIGRMLS